MEGSVDPLVCRIDAWSVGEKQEGSVEKTVTFLNPVEKEKQNPRETLTIQETLSKMITITSYPKGETICKCREEKSTRRLTSQRAPSAEREHESHAEDGLGAALSKDI